MNRKKFGQKVKQRRGTARRQVVQKILSIEPASHVVYFVFYWKVQSMDVLKQSTNYLKKNYSHCTNAMHREGHWKCFNKPKIYIITPFFIYIIFVNLHMPLICGDKLYKDFFHYQSTFYKYNDRKMLLTHDFFTLPVHQNKSQIQMTRIQLSSCLLYTSRCV